MRAINMDLVEALQSAVGSVVVARPGEAAGGHHAEIAGRVKYKFQSAGEYYRVCCPYCRDTRHRLWVHHLWGVGVDSRPEDPFWWAAYCFNEGCLSKPGKLQDFRKRVWNEVGRARRQCRLTHSIPHQLVYTDVALPGDCVPVDQLGDSHHAVRYLVSRGLDPVEMARDFQVTYCARADQSFGGAQDRLIFPIYMRGKRLAWQGRFIGDLDWKASGIPKYYTMPGAHVKQMLYGFDAAKPMPFVIITEGVTDVCALGAGVVALFGKTMSSAQFELLVHNWQTIVILLDDDAYRESEDLYYRLRHTRKVVRVLLPQGVDPAKSAQLDPNYLWDLIYGSACAQGVELGVPC